MRKRKSEEETNRNIRSLSERINITNDPLLPILTSSEAETTTGTNDATEEPVEVGFLENFKVTQKGHVFQNLKKKKKKKKKRKNRKIPIHQRKKATNKNKLKQKQNREENLQNKQQDKQINEVKKKETMTKPKIFNLSNKVLSQQNVNVPRRGLKFTPTPLTNKIELKKDAQQFSRQLRLLKFFNEQNESEEEKSSDGSIIKTKSTFNNHPRNR